MKIERQTGQHSPRRVLLIGWDAADWQMVQPLIDRGMMLTLAGLMGAGAWGNLASLRPMLSPILWNSIATGKRAGEHGVYGFTEPNPDAPGVRPRARADAARRYGTCSRRVGCARTWSVGTRRTPRSRPTE